MEFSACRTRTTLRTFTRTACGIAVLTGILALLSVGAATAATATVQRNPDALPPAPSCTVDTAKELMINDLSVVEDCFRTTWTGLCPIPVAPATRGAWTFGKLVEGLAGTTDPNQLNSFVRNWLAHWESNVTVNGDFVPARPFIRNLVITPWETASGSTVLDMKKAPLRLLAIVFRADLRQAPAGYGQPGNAGEARFVFGVLNLNSPSSVPQFTVILEYGLDADDCAAIQNWAQSFHALGSLPFGQDFNAALQGITDLFTTIGASPAKPNGSAINQVRTNEIALSFPWELREFRLRAVVRQLPQEPIPTESTQAELGTAAGAATSGGTTSTIAQLKQVTVAQTPDADLQGQQIIADYINTNEAAILSNTHVVPLSFQSQPFRGGAAPNNLNLGWDGPGGPCSTINNPVARFNFSLNTCNGCHGDDTGTGFLQVHPRSAGNPAFLSPFLTGGTAVDVCGLTNNFNDLERRRLDLCNLLAETCDQILAEEPLNLVH